MNLERPILIYISKAGCPACQSFENEWKKLAQRLEDKLTLVKFTNSHNVLTPPALQKYVNWYPCILLAGPKSYYRIFTPQDTINQVDYSPNYVIKAKQCNAVETAKGIEFAGRPFTADLVLAWLGSTINSVDDFDEPTPPKQYVNYF